MNPQDYDEDGNNIVPCPICLSAHCSSKEGGKCPEEDDFAKATKPMHQNTDWEKELREELWTEVMEDYVITAELGHLAKDQGKHKEEMRGHFDKLLNWYAQKLQAREEEIREILKSFRDDSEKPTEIGLLIENILARLTPNKK